MSDTKYEPPISDISTASDSMVIIPRDEVVGLGIDNTSGGLLLDVEYCITQLDIEAEDYDREWAGADSSVQERNGCLNPAEVLYTSAIANLPVQPVQDQREGGSKSRSEGKFQSFAPVTLLSSYSSIVLSI